MTASISTGSEKTDVSLRGTPATAFRLRFGNLVPKLADQLRANGVRVGRGGVPGETVRHLQRDIDALQLLRSRGVVTLLEARAAERRLVAKIEMLVVSAAK